MAELRNRLIHGDCDIPLHDGSIGTMDSSTTFTWIYLAVTGIE